MWGGKGPACRDEAGDGTQAQQQGRRWFGSRYDGRRQRDWCTLDKAGFCVVNTGLRI